MEKAFTFVIVLVLCLSVYSKPFNTHTRLQNINSESIDGHGHVPGDFSWAKGDQSCFSLLKESVDFLALLPPSSSQFIKPALAMGLMDVGCLQETDQLYTDLLQDKSTRLEFRLLAKQRNTSTLKPSSNRHTLKDLELELLKFNLDSILPATLPVHYQNCSGFYAKQNVILNGLDVGVHSTAQEAKVQCDNRGPSCAGISLDKSGNYHSVGRYGGYIMPQIGTRVWLHHCNVSYLRRRSTDSECISEKEQRIHKVMQWVPGVSGLYNAGSAIYYASQGCSKQAEERAVEASVDIGYDAVLATTGGAVKIVGHGVGLAVKPALKSGVQSAIHYFKGGSEQ